MKKLLFTFIAIACISFVFSSCTSDENKKMEADDKKVQKISAKTAKTSDTKPKSIAQKASLKNVPEGEGIKWLSIEEAQSLNAKNPKKILMDVYTPWCGPCKMLDRMTFNQPEVIEAITKDFYPVKFNAESGESLTFNGKTFANPNFDPKKSPRQRNYPHEFSRTLGVRGYPALVIFDSKLNKIKMEMGFKKAPQMLALLNSVK